ncbi:hypothetical protein [Streptomyces sp. NPDC056632]|uniref:hypothetical protein n=1 Tax=Streptomyces sp. NPDC056632 TaxID=3345884 RepID=UPI0036A2BE10
MAGLFVTPLFINAFLLIDATATDDTRVEANTWVGASTDITNGIMAIVIGALAEHQRWDLALLTLSCCAAAGAAGRLLPSARRTTPARPAEPPLPEPRPPKAGPPAPSQALPGEATKPTGDAASMPEPRR